MRMECENAPRKYSKRGGHGVREGDGFEEEFSAFAAAHGTSSRVRRRGRGRGWQRKRRVSTDAPCNIIAVDQQRGGDSGAAAKAKLDFDSANLHSTRRLVRRT